MIHTSVLREECFLHSSLLHRELYAGLLSTWCCDEAKEPLDLHPGAREVPLVLIHSEQATMHDCKFDMWTCSTNLTSLYYSVIVMFRRCRNRTAVLNSVL
jgi:hypothetical protein